MSSENGSDEIPANLSSENEPESDNSFEQLKPTEISIEELSKLLELEKQKVLEHEEELKHVLADFQNLNRKTQSDIENGVNAKVYEFVLDFLKIYDDFVRAKEVFSERKVNTAGLDSILKNMDSLLKKYHVIPIDALGKIFDPNFHEAISIITDPDLDDNTITKEIRKGYISHELVVRPTLVEISKKG
ncbi:nucleotide exchange factor GrpE [Marine Group I thaumarchaeote]|uniref:Protein GrpE n=1 Tax=Marine Group I thaumarchaeote TaxID=2511932 RepID=A0A7K4P2A5_9ARCH|nr:MAG: nucleotide exchange factor GrpE [Nitrosopumilus sp. YT1]NMI82464.1 nucleotide exchange factor GrpE [Candidatus Nitrosopumilus sp. MTA1]NWJ20505.1 nucleotide exchange factor GrpE [Marine Group I thaumarchaeote]NWJ28689.1 nucleotide exchange factor GrpE [Marine Group I thaumarchaeote]NWJ83144.1 nucleotide exchange factor GrpE [Marine Group I thaumarchaeote]